MSDEHIFNLNEALARADQDMELFQTMAELFLEHGPKDMAEIRTALAACDAAAAGRSAHRLKGAVLQFCAPATLEAAKRMEEMGKAGDVAAAAGLCDELECELARLLDAIRHVMDKGLAA
ncbi:MAG: Hpt domain-containing protein [Nitrospira sp.]|nr:Hpt domain-containing protein [Nitrospira sp.]MBH0180731.1 Hpt domain-containing protein [Nitrospira sp.]